VFVDIDPTTFNIDPAKLEEAIAASKTHDTSLYPQPLNPKCIIPVDLFGLPADYERIEAIAKKYGLFVIEDAAQSFGAEYREKKACAFGHIAATSFFPAKPLGCYGDGGMCFTDDAKLAEALRSIRVHGKGSHKYDNARIGVNGRLDTLQAAVLLAKFGIFPEEVELRQMAAARYTELLSQCSTLTVPGIPEGYASVWAQYSILTNGRKRDDFQKALKKHGIPTAIYYPKPLHLQTAFKGLGYKSGDFPISEDASERIFSIPMHPYLTEEDQTKIVNVINTLC